MPIAPAARRFIRQLEPAIDQSRKRLARNLFIRLVDGTPVDTGHLKFNWQVNFSGPTAERPGVDPAGARTKAEGLALIEIAPDGSTIYLFNPTSYGKYVDEFIRNFRNVTRGRNIRGVGVIV